MTMQRKTTLVVGAALCLAVVGWWIVSGLENGPSPEVQGLQQDGQGWSLGGLAVSHGQVADFTVSVLNKSNGTITLDSVSLVPGAMELPPRLSHIGVFNGKGIAGSSSGWPPKDTSPVVAFRGYTGRPGWIQIAVGLSGRRRNVIYGIIGVNLTYTAGGVKYHTLVTGSGGQFCVVSPKSARSCLRRIEALQNRYY